MRVGQRSEASFEARQGLKVLMAYGSEGRRREILVGEFRWLIEVRFTLNCFVFSPVPTTPSALGHGKRGGRFVGIGVVGFQDGCTCADERGGGGP